MDCWLKRKSRRRQPLDVKKRRFACRQNLEIFAIPPCERDLFYQAVQPVWIGIKISQILAIPTPVVFLYMTVTARAGTGLERDWVQKVAEVEYHVSPLGKFLSGACYGLIEWLAFSWIVAGCEGGGALLRVPLCTIKSWYAFGICWLLRNMALDLLLVLVATK